MTAPERQDRSVDIVGWAAVDDREKIVRFSTRSEPVLSRNGGFGANLAIDSRSANDGCRPVSGSPLARSQASAQRR